MLILELVCSTFKLLKNSILRIFQASFLIFERIFVPFTGLETATSLAMHDCHVIMACRSTTRAEEAAEKIRSMRRNAHCDVMKLDLSSLKSVKEFAEAFKSKYKLVSQLFV